MFKAVIFDLDGTLTDTLKSIQTSADMALADVGYAPIEPSDRYRYFVGDGSDELLRRALIASGDEELVHFDEIKERYAVHFKKYCNYEVHPYDGIKDLIASLKEKGLLLAVNSNKPHPRTIDVVEEKFGKGTFDMIVGQSDERARKPAPDGVFYILNELGLSKEEVLYIGDTCVDMQTGKNAGIYTVGALWGFRDRAELEENHADAIIAHPLDLLQIIGG